jgi:signal transduction histidine kinase
MFGALLWTAGLLLFAHVLSVVLLLRYPKFSFIAHGSAVSLGAIGLILAGISQIKRGVSPFTQLRQRLSAVRDGRCSRVEGRYPDEVQPLVDDLNSLLDHRDLSIRRAQAKAGDLAHGLKTPLAVLAYEAERIQSSGHAAFAETILQQVEQMHRQMDYHLAQARASSGAASGKRCSIKDCAEGLARTLQKLYVERGLAIEVSVSSDHFILGLREDLDEMLGNLLDNACKWARSRVTIGSEESGSDIVIYVDDDGRGIPQEMRDAVLQRGVRADERSGGSGLGLAIVRDLAELYRGAIALDSSSLGGLRVQLKLPQKISSVTPN